MISLSNEQICLLELVKASLFGLTPVIPENTNWEKVFLAAKAQCIVPLIASFVPLEQGKSCMEVTCQNKAHFMQILYEQDCLVSLLKFNSIPFVIIKGTAAAIYYPVPSLRTYGDIDFYVAEENVEIVKNLMENNGYIYLHDNYRHYEYYKNGIEYELHKRISSVSYNYVDRIFLKGLNNSVEKKVGNYSFPCFSNYENGLVLLGHMMQHLKDSGIGLRQILDWMMFVNKELDDSAWYDHFQVLAVEAGLEKLAVTVTFMCKKWLGLPNVITWCSAADEVVADQLMIRILDDGNLGQDRTASVEIKNSIRNEGTLKYLQRAGLENWTFAQKHIVFRPFAWLYQLFRYAGKGLAGLFTGKKVFMKNKHNMSLEELWERLE